MKAYSTVAIVSLTLILVFGSVVWAQGYMGETISFECLQITGVSVNSVSDLTSVTGGVLKGAGWNVIVSLRNTGSTDATISNVYLNEKPVDVCVKVAVNGGNGYVQSRELSIPVKGGTNGWISITIEKGEDSSSSIAFTSGSTLNIRLHSSSGVDYLAMVRLV